MTKESKIIMPDGVAKAAEAEPANPKFGYKTTEYTVVFDNGQVAQIAHRPISWGDRPHDWSDYSGMIRVGTVLGARIGLVPINANTLDEAITRFEKEVMANKDPVIGAVQQAAIHEKQAMGRKLAIASPALPINKPVLSA